MHIERAGRFPHWIPILAAWHFEYWGQLTGAATLAQYTAALDEWSTGDAIPTVLIAEEGGELLGSVNLLRSEMRNRPALTPWLAQLFVAPGVRQRGVGEALVTAAIAHARRCGFSKLYLYTSGTLPRYYARLGWDELERVEYLGKGKSPHAVRHRSSLKSRSHEPNPAIGKPVAA